MALCPAVLEIRSPDPAELPRVFFCPRPEGHELPHAVPFGGTAVLRRYDNDGHWLEDSCDTVELTWR